MRPEDEVKRRLSDPFENGAPRLLDAWEAANGSNRHPDSFCLFEQPDNPPRCYDFILVTEDLASRVCRVTYDQESKASDHQPVLLELDM